MLDCFVVLLIKCMWFQYDDHRVSPIRSAAVAKCIRKSRDGLIDMSS